MAGAMRRKRTWVLVGLLIGTAFTVTNCNPLIYFIHLFGIDKNYSIEDKSWLDKRIAEWRPQGYRASRGNEALRFGVDTHIFIGMGELGGAETELSSYAMSNGLLNVFLDADVDIIRVGGLDDAWRTNNREEIELSDSLMTKIRASGKTLLIADTQHSPLLLKNRVSWEEFRKIHLQRIEFLLKRYNPDYYCVVTEPSVYHHYGVGGKMDHEKWVHQAEAAVNLVKRVNPRAQTLVSVGPENEEDRSFLQRAFHIRNLDIVGIEAYYPRDINLLEQWLSSAPNRRGKKLWMTETWSGMPFPYTNVKGKDIEDAKWIQAMAYFAQKYELDAVLVWPFQYFVTYERFDDGKKRIDFSRRTASFWSFKKMIEEVRGKSSGARTGA